MRIGNTELQPLTKNLLFINIILFIATLTLPSRFGVDLYYYLAARYPLLDSFKPIQLLSHMFMHGSFSHLLFNMLFGVYMFGNFLEGVLGTKRYAILYFVSGFGAIGLDLAIRHYYFIGLQDFITGLKPSFPDLIGAKEIINIDLVKTQGRITDSSLMQLSQAQINVIGSYYMKIAGTLVGASGCIYGVLAAFGYLFPNQKMMLIFIPYPIAAKYFIPGILAMNLLFLVNPSLINSNIGWAAHIGGALFGFLLVIFWNKYNKKTFY